MMERTKKRISTLRYWNKRSFTAVQHSRAAQEWDNTTQAIVVPFHFGPKHDTMISLDSKLKQLLPAGMRLLSDNQSNIGSLSIWLQREANLSQPLTPENIGVVLLAHGVDLTGMSKCAKRYSH